MKKFGCVFVLLLFSIISFSQNITEVEARELLGERFITTSEAGYPDILDIPFSKENLLYDRISWLIPLNINGVLQYRLIQARYLADEYQNYDTLSLNEAEEVVRITNVSNRNFPNADSLKFFRTKNQAIDRNGLDFQKTLFCFGDSYDVVNLPCNTSIVLMENKNMTYIIDDQNKTIISIDIGNNDFTDSIQGVSVLTLVYLY
jgi:hypothetical protein